MKNIPPILFIIGMIMAIYFAFDFYKNSDNYSVGGGDEPPAWCSGIYCD